MNAILRAKLYGAGITSPDMLAHAIDSSTAKASPAPRLTPSRRYRRWKVIGARLALLAVAIAAVLIRA